MSFETGYQKTIENWIAEEYTPHYPTISGGKGVLVELFNQLQQMEIKVNIVRSFEDGDYVILHSEYGSVNSFRYFSI